MVRTFQINQLFNTMTPLETLAMVVSQQRGLGGRGDFHDRRRGLGLGDARGEGKGGAGGAGHETKSEHESPR